MFLAEFHHPFEFRSVECFGGMIFPEFGNDKDIVKSAIAGKSFFLVLETISFVSLFVGRYP
jgi:hypothetical protein